MFTLSANQRRGLMLKIPKLPFLVFLVFCLNGLIYLKASISIEEANMVFAECARNSGRTAAALNLILLFMLGYFGLKTIYNNALKKDAFRILVSLYTVNHLIHFFFVFQNFKSQAMMLDVSHNLHGFITYITIILFPIVLWACRRLNPLLYIGTILYFFNVTYFICASFYSRYKPEDPAYLHRLGILIMIGMSIYILYRIIQEQKPSKINVSK